MSARRTEKSEKKLEKNRFQEGERILCYHGPLIYEAKCLNLKKTNDTYEYYIHYSGWNTKWDEWVSEDRILKYNDENLEKKKELQKEQKSLKKFGKRKLSVSSISEKEESNSSPSSPKITPGRKNTPKIEKLITNKSSSAEIEKPESSRSNNSKTKKSDIIQSNTLKTETSKVDLVKNNVIKEDKSDFITPTRKKKDFIHSPELEFYEHIVIKIKIEDDLRSLIVQDLEFICKRKKLVKLPSRVPIDDITEKYIVHKLNVVEEPTHVSKYKETAYALKDYFNAVLAKKLLYAFEKPQYNKYFENKHINPSSVYGLVHLVRLLTQIGHLLAHLSVNENESNIIENNINDYARYLNLNVRKFICIDDYQPMTAEYQRKIKDVFKQ